MENKKTNQERLEEYLVGTDGYLKSDISNGKVIMLSGKWGSGKTHFWQNKIQTVLNGNEKEKKIPNNYISLYGKTTIEEIRNEVFLKIFESMDIFKIDDKSFGLAKNTASLVADLTKTVSVFGFNLDLSEIVDKSFEKLEKVKENNKNKKTKECLKSGAIICFDDFERKSKDIDLNDLFGFITNLTIEFDCKVVIILNDDVFEGEEKKIFSNVKEKSVSKFLKYEPSIEELFNLIFELEIEKDNKKQKKYKDLEPYKEIILKTIEETQELNARIYIQVLDNLVEWIEKINITNENYIKYFIYVNVNFILNHVVLYTYIKFAYEKGITITIKKSDDKFESKIQISIDTNLKLPSKFQDSLGDEKSVENLKNKIKMNENQNQNMNSQIVNNSDAYMYIIDNNMNLIRSLLFFKKLNLEKLIESHNQAECDIFNKINNFIESGILINE